MVLPLLPGTPELRRREASCARTCANGPQGAFPQPAAQQDNRGSRQGLQEGYEQLRHLPCYPTDAAALGIPGGRARSRGSLSQVARRGVCILYVSKEAIFLLSYYYHANCSHLPINSYYTPRLCLCRVAPPSTYSMNFPSLQSAATLFSCCKRLFATSKSSLSCSRSRASSASSSCCFASSISSARRC